MTDSTTTSRQRWARHPNFPKQVLLLRSHDNFRHISNSLLERAEAARQASPYGSPNNTHLHEFRNWKAAMKSHERYEESKLYPYLRARFSLSTDSLETQHEELSVLEAQVYDAFETRSSQEVASALSAHDKFLNQHLCEEEKLVVPLLLGLKKDEFVRLTTQPIGQLLSRLHIPD